MVELGLLEEAKWLYDNFPEAQSGSWNWLQGIISLFSGEQTLDEAFRKPQAKYPSICLNVN